jgi:beta-glucosidase
MMKKHVSHAARLGVALIALASAGVAMAAPNDAEQRAAATVKAMTPEEKTVLTHGIMPLPIVPNAPPPLRARSSARALCPALIACRCPR